MLKGKDWNDLFYNGENKEDLIQMISSFMKNDGQNMLRIPLVINCKNETWRIARNLIETFRKVYDHLGHICSTLPQFHAITGCDQRAFKFNVGKPRTFAKKSNNPSLQ